MDETFPAAGTDPAAGPAAPRSLRLALALAYLALLAALALLVLDYQIKGQLAARAKQLHDDLTEREGTDHGTGTGQLAADPRQAPLPSRGALDGLAVDPGASPDSMAPGGVTHGAGGLLARGPGDGSSSDES